MGQAASPVMFVPTSNERDDMSSPMDQVSADDAKGFFGALFDFSFSSYITLKFIKLIYVVVTVVIGLMVVIFLITALASGSTGTIVLGIIVAPLFGLFFLIYARIMLEIIAIIFAIGGDTANIRTLMESRNN